jgi:murein tripeptide amidase MpaA
MYRTASQIESAMNILALWFPSFFTRVALPEPSIQGRSIHALRIRAGGGTDRRGVLVVGGTHARELMNPDAIVDLAIDLLLSYENGTNIVYGSRTWRANDIRVILEAMDVWLVPCCNPDGREYVMTVDDMWRKNRRDNPGTSCDGVDLNRNADVVWGVAQGQTSCSPCADVYCGPSAFSEPETRNIKYLLDSARIVSFVDVHSYSELVLYPWGHAPTQSTDPSQRFTGLTTGTCTASIPGTYREYMPPADVQRFTRVAGRIVDDIAAVRGRHYTAEASIALYATTGTQGDYAYSRHIANPSLYKTYGFTFETGPNVGNPRDSFHPADPSLIQRDAKAAILSLLQQSVCSIELIGLNLTGSGSTLTALRVIRDKLLASTAAGREWIALFERTQFQLLSAVMVKPKLLAMASELLQSARAWLSDDAVVPDEDLRRAIDLLKRLRADVKNASLRKDLDAVNRQLHRVGGRRVRSVVESLLRSKPHGSQARPATRRRTSKVRKEKKSKVSSGKKTKPSRR